MPSRHCFKPSGRGTTLHYMRLALYPPLLSKVTPTCGTCSTSYIASSTSTQGMCSLVGWKSQNVSNEKCRSFAIAYSPKQMSVYINGTLFVPPPPPSLPRHSASFHLLADTLGCACSEGKVSRPSQQRGGVSHTTNLCSQVLLYNPTSPPSGLFHNKPATLSITHLKVKTQTLYGNTSVERVKIKIVIEEKKNELDTIH